MANTTTTLSYDPNATYDVKSIDVEYRRDGDLALLATIHQPQGAGPFPTLIDVHGGAWAPQSRLLNVDSALALARSGLLIAAIDFRTSGDAPHPAALEDINYAIRWLKAHASEYGGSPAHLGGIGWSSGGHQIMLSAMRPSTYATLPLAEAPELDAKLAYVVMGWPVIDPVSRYHLAEGRGDESLMGRHMAYFGSMESMEEASPPAILARGEAVELPPALLIQGSADESLTRMMAENFIESYSLAGGLIEAGKYPGEPHGFLRDPADVRNRERAFGQIKSFIARRLAELGE